MVRSAEPDDLLRKSIGRQRPGGNNSDSTFADVRDFLYAAR